MHLYKIKNNKIVFLIILGSLLFFNVLPSINCTPISENAQNYIYSSYFGGSGKDVISDIGIDSQGNIIIVGGTFSQDLNTTGGYQTEYGGGASSSVHINGGDGFIFKLSPEGAIIWGTYLGGSLLECCNKLVIDNNDDIFVVGDTQSDNFPTTENANQSTYGGGDWDIFITKLHSNGSILYSSYLGGAGTDNAGICAMNNDDQLYVSLYTNSNSLSTSSDAFQSAIGGNSDVFLTIFANNLTQTLYSSYFGGSDEEFVYNIQVDQENAIILTGNILGEHFPVLNEYSNEFDGVNRDIFITKFASNNSLVFSTYLGGNQLDDPFGLTIGAQNEIIVSGRTASTDYPDSQALQTEFGGEVDGIISAFSSDGSDLLYSSYFGGVGWDMIHHVTSEKNGKLYGCGVAGSNFPLKNEFHDPTDSTTRLVLMQMSDDYQIEFSTYFGDSFDTTPMGIDYDSGLLFIAGITSSGSLFTSTDAIQPNKNTAEDGFIIRFAIDNYLDGRILSGRPGNLLFTPKISGYTVIPLGICFLFISMAIIYKRSLKTIVNS